MLQRYPIASLLLPPLFLVLFSAAYNAFISTNWLEETRSCEQVTHRLLSNRFRGRQQELLHLRHYQSTSQFFTQQHLEKLSLASKALSRLQLLNVKPNTPQNVKLLDKMRTNNHLTFEETMEGAGLEVRESLVEPVYIDPEDLFVIFNNIELSPLAPHYIVQALTIKRINAFLGWEVLQLDKLELIKRDYTCLK